ncbi:hypothetical protein ACFL5O_04455 [Myxococcota bacterium]
MPRTLSLILSTSLLAGPLLGACDKGALPNSQPTGQADQGTRSAENAATQNEPPIGNSKALAKAPKPGATLRHLPETCASMKLYVNLQRFGKYQKTGADIASVARKVLAQAEAHEDYLTPVLETLQKQGVSLTRDLRDVAACAENKNTWVALLAVDLTALKVDPAKLLVEAAHSAGQKNAQLRSESGVIYVEPQALGGALGFVAPGVLGFASSPALLSKAAVSQTQGMSVSDSQNHLATLRFPAGGEQATFALTGDQETLSASIILPLDEQQRAELRKDAVKYLSLLRALGQQRLGGDTMAKIQLPDLKQFFENFDRLDMSVTKEELSAKLTVSVERIRAAIAAIAAIDPADMERVVKAAGG